MQHYTGSLALATGFFRSDCACRSLVRVPRGAEFPRCSKCKKAVGWVFEQAAPYKLPPIQKSKGG